MQSQELTSKEMEWMEAAQIFIAKARQVPGEVKILIRTQDEMKAFFESLSLEQLRFIGNVLTQERFDAWIRGVNDNEKRFYVMFVDDDTGTLGNDGWGFDTIWECYLDNDGLFNAVCVGGLPQ